MDIMRNNEEVLNRIQEKRELYCYSIKVERDEMIGYIMRHDNLTNSVIECDVEAHIRRGSPRIEYMR